MSLPFVAEGDVAASFSVCLVEWMPWVKILLPWLIQENVSKHGRPAGTSPTRRLSSFFDLKHSAEWLQLLKHFKGGFCQDAYLEQ